MLPNVAVVGKFGAGKTTIADRLVKDYGYTRIGFATRLKEVAQQVYSPDGAPIDKASKYSVTRRSGEVVELSGRQLLQELGQVVKDMDRDIWIKWLAADEYNGLYGKGPFVIDDVRFPFEANYLADTMGFVIVRLDTPDEVRVSRYEKLYGRRPTEAELNHESEVEVDKIMADLVMPGDLQAAEIARLIVGSL